MIPHIIHYCWFGKNEKSNLINTCINSWKKYFPDYKIIEWNEDNYNIKKNIYVEEAYNCKKWAFVSDYARFDILYQYGGIYFDTDVEVLKHFDDEILDSLGFTGMESTYDIAPGLVFGCIPHLPLLKIILQEYESSHFVIDGKECPITVNSRLTSLMILNGYTKDGTKQKVSEITVYPSEYFCGYDLDIFEPCITDKTYSIHHYNSSWTYASFRIKRFLQKQLKRLVGINNYRRILSFIRRIKGKKGN